MKSLKNTLWLLPLLALIYMYANQGASVLLGSPEHYNILAALGWPPEVTSALVWTSVIVDFGMALLLIRFPRTIVFAAAALWTWVPRIITLMAPGPENEFFESLAVCVLAMLAYLAYTRGHALFIRARFARTRPAHSTSRMIR